eukprot:m.36360 g.36360  ORF g.36360 m.36360 type:complete len:70 (+) comp9988_c0_seq3:916-1125(+)
MRLPLLALFDTFLVLFWQLNVCFSFCVSIVPPAFDYYTVPDCGMCALYLLTRVTLTTVVCGCRGCKPLK